MMGGIPLLRHWILLGSAVWMAAALAGCGPAAQVRLFQPEYAGAEQDIQLISDHACWAPEQGIERILVEFPLPGAVSGRPTYLLYLRIPVVRPGEPAVPDKAHPIRGFLVQTQGRNAGLETLASGKVLMTGRSSAPESKRELQVELTFEHNTILSGRLTARRDDQHIRLFETRQHPADVKALDEQVPSGGSMPGAP
jgi:hypothetical protein